MQNSTEATIKQTTYTDQQVYISRASLDRRQRQGAWAGVDRLDFATCSSPAA